MHGAEIKPALSCTAEDGEFVGHLLVDAAFASSYVFRPNKRRQASVVSAFVVKTEMLRTCEFAGVDVMLAAIIRNTLRPSKFVPTHEPAELTQHDALTIGRGFASSLVANTMPSAAVDEFILMYPAMGVLAARHAWFRPMLKTISTRLMAVAPLGLKLRVTIGCTLSYSDVFSDIYMIFALFEASRSKTAIAIIATIALGLLLQVFVVIVQNRRKPWRKLAKEVLIVLLFLKPAVDALRVARAQPRESDTPLDPTEEMLFCKAMEVLCEAGPGAVIQTAAILSTGSGEISHVAVASVVFSCMVTAYLTTTMSFDLDTHPTKRKLDPLFYGYPPLHPFPGVRSQTLQDGADTRANRAEPHGPCLRGC